jgi:hypothetical protein
MRPIVKIGAFAVIGSLMAILGQRIGCWDFSGWMNVPHGVEYPDITRAIMSVELDSQEPFVIPFMLQSDSDELVFVQ